MLNKINEKHFYLCAFTALKLLLASDMSYLNGLLLLRHRVHEKETYKNPLLNQTNE